MALIQISSNLPKDELAQLYKEDNKKYMELWDECNSKSEQLITSAVKLMQFEPAVLTQLKCQNVITIFQFHIRR